MDAELTCGACRHWKRKPPDPGDLNNVRGDCLESPPSVTAYPNGVTICAYPSLPPNFPACHRHQPPESACLS